MTPNKTLFQTFEWHTPSDASASGFISHYAYLTAILPSLSLLGITALWLPPGSKANNPQGNGYDCYDLWDLGEFAQKGSGRTKWGDREELAALLSQARENNIECIWDAVLNHKAGADAVEEGVWAVEVDDHDRRVEIQPPEKIDAWLRFDFPGRNGKYSEMQWRSEHFNGTDWDHLHRRQAIFKLIDDPPEATARSHQNISAPNTPEAKAEASRWLDRLRNRSKAPGTSKRLPTRRAGKGWANDVDSDRGNYDYLMFSNIDYSHTSVLNDTLAWGEWMVTDIGVSGFRLDAAKHMSTTFTRLWIDHVQKVSRTNHQRTPLIIGEVWTADVNKILRWLDAVQPTTSDHCNNSQIYAYDAPLLHTFSSLSTFINSPSPPKRLPLKTLCRHTLLGRRPDAAITLVTNHDTQPGQTSAVPMAAAIKPLAYAYILLREGGLPCVFWGDVFGTRGPLAEAPVRFAATSTESGRKLHFDHDAGVVMALVACRARFAYGAQREYIHERCLGWTRAGEEGRPGCAVVVNFAPVGTAVRMNMTIGVIGDKYKDVLTPWKESMAGEEVIIDRSGTGEFTCGGMSVSVYVRDDLIGDMDDLPDVTKMYQRGL